MTAVLRCPVCERDLTKKMWSPAQWNQWDPWHPAGERNCCVNCQDAQSGEANTWHTRKKANISRGDYMEYVAELRKGWQQSSQSSQSRRSRSRSASPAHPPPTHSVWSDPPELVRVSPLHATATLAITDSSAIKTGTVYAQAMESRPEHLAAPSQVGRSRLRSTPRECNVPPEHAAASSHSGKSSGSADCGKPDAANQTLAATRLQDADSKYRDQLHGAYRLLQESFGSVIRMDELMSRRGSQPLRDLLKNPLAAQLQEVKSAQEALQMVTSLCKKEGLLDPPPGPLPLWSQASTSSDWSQPMPAGRCLPWSQSLPPGQLPTEHVRSRRSKSRRHSNRSGSEADQRQRSRSHTRSSDDPEQSARDRRQRERKEGEVARCTESRSTI